MGDERTMTDQGVGRTDVVDPTEPSPGVEREVEPETLMRTVERELTVIREADAGPEPQDDTDPNSSDGAAHAEVEVDGVLAADVAAPLAPAEDEVPSSIPGAHVHHRTHGRLKTWVIVAGALAGLALATFGSTYSPLFAADTVRVEGAGHLSATQVRRIAKIQPGVNVFRLDTRQAERRLERNAWVGDATVARRLPSSVTITIVERVPAAVTVTDPSGDRSIVAEDGTILAPAPDTAALPLVEAADGATVPSEGQRTLGAQVAASFPPEIAGRVEAVQAGADGTVIVILTGGVAVSYGDAEALVQKGQSLRAVLRWAERAGVALGSVDVRTPGAPSARLAGGTTVVRGGPW